MFKILPTLSVLLTALSLTGCGTEKKPLEQPKIDFAANEALRIKHAADQYMVQNAKCPATVGDLEAAGMLQDAPDDPWGNPYTLTCSDGSISVVSGGPDGAVGGNDDISASGI